MMRCFAIVLCLEILLARNSVFASERKAAFPQFDGDGGGDGDDDDLGDSTEGSLLPQAPDLDSQNLPSDAPGLDTDAKSGFVAPNPIPISTEAAGDPTSDDEDSTKAGEKMTRTAAPSIQISAGQNNDHLDLNATDDDLDDKNELGIGVDNALDGDKDLPPLTAQARNKTAFVTNTTMTKPQLVRMTHVPAPAPSHLRTPTFESLYQHTGAPELSLDLDTFPTATSPYMDAPSPYDDPYYTKPVDGPTGKSPDKDAKNPYDDPHDTKKVTTPSAPPNGGKTPGIGSTDDDAVIANPWKKQAWANKTPLEVAELASAEADNLLHDKYVPLVAAVISLVSFAFMLLVVQQIIENPNGALAKICRCTVACVRILCWPVRFLCCGGAAGCSSRARDRRTHQRLPSDGCSRDLELT